MIPEVRNEYNKSFTEEQYQEFHDQLYKAIGEHATFRLSETPIFLPDTLAQELLDSCNRISQVIADPVNLEKTKAAMREPYWSIAGDPERPIFLQYDFALCQSENGIRPWLIELQGFPSLYFFQADLARSFRKNLPAVSLEELERDGRTLFYRREGRRIPVKRIYNRVILDELLTKDMNSYAFSLREEVDVEWAGHPDWFLRISKHTLPAIGHLPNVPETTFVSEYKPGSWDLTQYVLKPLFSFSGAGVNLNPTEDHIAELDRPQNWILQRKVKYGPVLNTPSGPAKCEIRMMLLWKPGDDLPTVVNNLVRITKGEMTGVRYNNEASWVGASVAMHKLNS